MSESELIEDEEELGTKKQGNSIALWGSPSTMNLNSLIYTNIMQSPYFKTELIELKTYHEVIDEIYYKVEHLEPWERGSRRTAGQTGMCGGVRGVGAGGIVSTPYCLLYKLFTLKLTRKQLRGLLDHPDSPYIRALGFMYIRYCINPQDHWDWYKDYMDDDEELDVKAGGGCTMTIGEMINHFLTKLDWFSTLFPRIPVPIQKKLDVQLREHRKQRAAMASLQETTEEVPEKEPEKEEKPVKKRKEDEEDGREKKERERPRERDREQRDRERDRHRERDRERDRGRDRERERKREYRDRSQTPPSRHRGRSPAERYRDRSPSDRHKERSSGDRHRERRSRSRDRYRHKRSPSPDRFKSSDRRHRERSDSFERDLRRERERQARRH